MHNILIVDDQPVRQKTLANILSESFYENKVMGCNKLESSMSDMNKEEAILLFICLDSNDQQHIEDLVSYFINSKIVIFYTDYVKSADHIKKFGKVNALISQKNKIENIVEGCRTVLDGRLFLCNYTQESFIIDFFNTNQEQFSAHRHQKDGHRNTNLTDKEEQIKSLLVQGMRVSDIGRLLNLKMSYVSMIKANILKKLKVSSLVELINL